MEVEEQWRAEAGLRRRIARHAALQTAAIGGLAGAAFAFWLVLALAPAAAYRPGVAALLATALAVRERRALGRLRAQAHLPAGQAERTHAEEVAEAVEALRQRQWAAITERAFLAAGAPSVRAPAARPAPETDLMRPSAGAVRLDPRWEWRLVQRLGMPDEWVKARCRHTEVEPVESAAGEAVAQLCLTCDTQFPAPREP